MLLVVGLLAVFVGLLVALIAVGSIVEHRRQGRRRLALIGSLRAAWPGYRPELETPFAARIVVPALDALSRLGRRLAPSNQSLRIRRRLDLAGNPPHWDVDRVLAFKMLGLFLGLLLGVVLPYLLGTSLLIGLGITILLAVLGYATPSMVLYQLGYNRTSKCVVSWRTRWT